MLGSITNANSLKATRTELERSGIGVWVWNMSYELKGDLDAILEGPEEEFEGQLELGD